MPKYLDEAGVRKLWAKTKQKASEAQNNAVGTAGNYTVNNKKISSNPILNKSDIGLDNVDNVAQIPMSQKGAASGVATLGTDSKLTSSQLPALKTINGTSIVGSGNITIDLGIYTIVTALPTTGINKNKIYLVLTNKDQTQDRYTEYIYTGDTSATYDASKWEKLGEYKADVDLSAYLKTADANKTYFADVSKTISTRGGSIDINLTSEDGTKTKSVTIPAASAAFAGLMTTSDKMKLDGIAAGANAYSHPAGSAASKTEGFYKISTDAQSHVKSVTNVTKADITALGIPAQDTTYVIATTSANGLMSKEDKSKLNGIAAGAEVNQNAFSNVVVGSTTIAADSKTDSLTLVAGSNVTITPDATNDKITIAATNTDTKVTQNILSSSAGFYPLIGSNTALTSSASAPTAETNMVNKIPTLLYSAEDNCIKIKESDSAIGSVLSPAELVVGDGSGVAVWIGNGVIMSNLGSSTKVFTSDGGLMEIVALTDTEIDAILV